MNEAVNETVLIDIMPAGADVHKGEAARNQGSWGREKTA